VLAVLEVVATLRDSGGAPEVVDRDRAVAALGESQRELLVEAVEAADVGEHDDTDVAAAVGRCVEGGEARAVRRLELEVLVRDRRTGDHGHRRQRVEVEAHRRQNIHMEERERRRDLMASLVAELRERTALVAAGGGERAVERHRTRGKLLARERIDRLVDPGGAFLELGALAAWELYDGDAPSAGIVTGIGVVEGRECAI